MNSINLLDSKDKTAPTYNVANQRMLRRIAVGLLFLVSTCAVIVYILIAVSPLPELKRQRKAASLNLSLSSKEIIKLSLIKERTDNITQLISKRPKTDKVLEEFQNKLPANVEIESMKIKKKNLIVVVSSKSLFSLNTFLAEIMKNENSSTYSSIALANLGVNTEKNNFSMTLDIDLL